MSEIREVPINRETLTALANMQATFAWKIFEAHWENVRRETVNAIMSPSLEPDERERLIAIQAGRDEVMRWIRQTLDQNRPVEQPMRAGLNE